MKHSDYHGKLLRLAMFFVALFLCGTMAYAQTDRMISGIVVDENGDPLPAAHIRQVSQTKGEELAAVITDMNGHFRLTLLRTAKEIEISYLGYESKKVRLTSANSYRIILEPASELLDEVVVTGYQTISRERATGSFAKVDSKKLETQRLSSVSSLMEGRIAGYSDGKIRGVTSMNGLTTPLYVIDGFPVEKTISDGLGNWVENVPDLNIEDIENITVLKDAAATSIYGARAANGVVVITTKKAGKNQLNVSFSATLTVRPYNFYTGHLAGTADMIEMEKEWAAMNPNLQGEGASQYAQNLLDNASMYSCLGVQAILKHHTGAISEAQMEQTLHELASQGFRYYDDVKKYGKRNPFSQQYNLNIGRGTEKNTFNASLSYRNNREEDKYTDSESFGLNLQNTTRLTSWLSLDLGTYLNYGDGTTQSYNLFDITVGSESHTPSTIDSVQLESDGRRCTLGREGIRLDLSGFIKGYALDRIRPLLLERGIKDALVSLGNSSIMAMGDVPGPVKDGCLTTSGNSSATRRHIVNPLTGEYACGEGSVSVRTSSGAEGEVAAKKKFLDSRI